jgi:hypothetical protein
VVERLLAAGPLDDPLEVIEDDEVLEQIDLYWVPSREVRAEGRTNGGGRFVREAVIELDGNSQRPFLVHAWRQGTG